jgi:arginine decarboxylase-like protein
VRIVLAGHNLYGAECDVEIFVDGETAYVVARLTDGTEIAKTLEPAHDDLMDFQVLVQRMLSAVADDVYRHVLAQRAERAQGEPPPTTDAPAWTPRLARLRKTHGS